MADCELLQGCIFFNDKMEKIPATAEIFKIRYCRGDSSECARHMIFEKLGRSRVTEDLFPNQVDKARTLLAKG